MSSKRETVYDLTGKARKVYPHEAEDLVKKGKATKKQKKEDKSKVETKEDKTAKATK